MIAHVVPILRLRRGTTWWSYSVPPKQRLQPGCLVVVPFRGRPELGIVWGIEESDAKATERVSEILSQRPLVTAPHRHLIEYLSETGLCSLSTALYMWLPPGLRELPLTADARRLLSLHDGTEPDLARPQRAILVPGRRFRQESLLKEKFGQEAEVLFAEDAKSNLVSWFKIAAGTSRVGIGREGALFAPWSNLRHLTVIEPEDIAYYHEQSPYLSLVPAARELAGATGAELEFRSRLPEPFPASLWGNEASGTRPATVTVRELKRLDVINDELLADIRHTVESGKEVLILLNAHDRIVAVEDRPREKKLVPGIETLRKKIAHALGWQALEPHVRIGTRTILQEDLSEIGRAIVLLADPVLTAGTFADTLHGTADLAFLASLGVPCTVQTYRPEHQLIRALIAGTLAEFLGTVSDEQKSANLPPFGSLIACSLPGEDLQAAADVHAKLSALVESPWTIGHPFPAPWRKKPFIHVIIQAPEGSRVPVRLRTALASLPRPWRIQRDPWYLA